VESIAIGRKKERKEALISKKVLKANTLEAESQ